MSPVAAAAAAAAARLLGAKTAPTAMEMLACWSSRCQRYSLHTRIVDGANAARRVWLMNQAIAALSITTFDFATCPASKENAKSEEIRTDMDKQIDNYNQHRQHLIFGRRRYLLCIGLRVK